MKWENLTSREFDEAIEKSGGLCVLPLGCLETHGEHIVTGCDSLKAMAMVEKAAEMEDVVIFPTGMWVGDLFGYHAKDPAETAASRKRGNIAISPSLLMNIMTELCDEIHRNGFRKILIVNSHGGNVPFLKYFMRVQTYKKRDYATMWTWANHPVNKIDYVWEQINARPQDFPKLTEEEMATLEHFLKTGYGGGHADFTETVLCMAANPDYVRPDKYDSVSGQSIHVADRYGAMGIDIGGAWGANYPNAYSGYPPFGATENIGKVYTQLAGEHLAEIFKMLKEDELCVELAQHKHRTTELFPGNRGV